MSRKQILNSPHRSLRDWRAAMGYTQEDCARLFGISQALYSRWETGRLRPKVRAAERVAKKTGVPILTLLGVAA